jgi:hypothetical protein
VVQRDALQLLGVRGWRRRAENRDEWRHALREAKGSEGAVVPYMDGYFLYVMELEIITHASLKT